MKCKKTPFLLILLSSGGISGVYATTLDYRHEYQDTGTNADRVLLSHSFQNGFGFILEQKWRTGGDNKDKPFTDVISSGHEITANWLLHPSTQINLLPGINLVSNDSRTIYRPFVRLQYNFSDTFYTAIRYRYEYMRYTNNSTKEDSKTNRGDLWLGYNINKFTFLFNYVYKNSEDSILANNKKWDQEFDVKIGYKINKQWLPYFHIGNISGSTTTSERQTRLRVGLTYNF